MTLSIEPTTSCNLQCVECVTGKNLLLRSKGEMKLQLFKKIIDELNHDLIYLSLYFQGEPLMCKDLFNMVRYAKKKKILVETSTNGNLIDNEIANGIVSSGVDSIIISVDGATEEIYQLYRDGGSLQKVTDGINYINHWKKELKSSTPFITIQFLVTAQNEHQLKEIKSLSKKWKAEQLVFKSLQIIKPENASTLLPSNAKHSRYKINADKKITLKKQKGNHCFRMWKGSVITWDGNVIPCCYDKNAEHFFGNINKTYFRNIWKSAEYNGFRKSILKNKKSISICNSNC